MCGRGFVVRMRYPTNTQGTHLGQIVVFCPRHTRGEAPRVKSLVFINTGSTHERELRRFLKHTAIHGRLDRPTPLT